MGSNKKNSGNHDERLLRLNSEKRTIERRRKNLGKSITDNLPTVEVDPKTLDLYSTVDPLPVIMDAMQPLPRLIRQLEYPKWVKRGKVGLYGWGDDENWGFIRQLLEMNAGQDRYNQDLSDDKEKNLSVLKKEIKEYSADLGLICGITKVDRRFIAEAADEEFPYDTAVVLGRPIDRELMEQVPYPQDKLFDFEVYVKLGRQVFYVADFVRSKGYRAYARAAIDGTVKYPPHAIMAGLGELGAGGWVITKEFGPWVRWTMLAVDADIDPDNPVDLNMSEYCDNCRRCMEACPGNAIPEERVHWRGVVKRKLNDKKCFPYFEKYDGCGICLKVCPIGRFGYEKCMKAYQEDGTILIKENRRD